MSLKASIYVLLCFVCLLGFNIGFATPSAYACSRGPTALEEDFQVAHAIFTAKVTKVDAVYPSQKAAVVEATELFKGQPPAFVVTNDDGDQCGAGLEEGETYLFYSQGVDLPYVSVFDTHRLGAAEELTQWLQHRTKKQEPGTPRIETLLAYEQGEIRIFFEHLDRGQPEQAFIANSSVYVPLSFFNDNLWFSTDWNKDTNVAAIGRTNRLEFEAVDQDRPHTTVKDTVQEISAEYNTIQIKVEGEDRVAAVLQDHPEAFVSNDEVFVPLRAIAEQLGYEVEWVVSSSSVILHLPFEKKTGPRMLSMRIINHDKPESRLEVDRLTGNEITYRAYRSQLPEGTEAKRETASVAETMPREERGVRKYTVQFYLKMDKKDIPLLMTHELVRKIESDASFRERVGEKLGKPWGPVQANRILDVTDFD